jgi:glycosyltransferase involved in cell wall biosynthesis
MRVLAIVPLIAPRLCPPVGPQTSAEAICGGKVILGLRRAGLELDVVAFDQEGAPSDSSSFWSSLSQGVTRFPESSTGSRWSRVCKAAKHRVPHWIEWTDQTVAWAGRRHASHPYGLVYSRSLPSAAHMAGYRVSRILRLPWIANMNDPWGPSVTPNCDDRVGWMERWTTLYWLKRTLKAADAVTYPSERLGRWHRKIGGMERRMEIIPHIGYAKPDSKANSARFVLSHAGSLVSGRSGATLLQAFANFLVQLPEARARARLQFVGKMDGPAEQDLARLGLKDVVTCTGTVSYERSLELIAESSALVLIEKPYPEGLFLPSKLSDYLAARRPILALSPAVGVVADLAVKHRGFIVAQPGDVSAVQNGIGRLYDAWRNGALECLAPELSLVNEFSSEALTKKLIAAFESAAA